MPTISELQETPRRALHIFYILDTSGSMGGAPIATLNRAMEETIEILKQQAKSNADALVKVAVLEFNSGCRWVQPNGPEEIEDFIWEDLEAGGCTDMGAALKELDSKLSRKQFLNSMTGAYLPVIIFMTDGGATDNYEKALDEISRNKWFERGIKIGFAIGDDADEKMIARIVGNSEAVVKTDDLELFARLLKFASVTASLTCSTSRTSTQAMSGGDIVHEVIRNQDIQPENVIADMEESFGAVSSRASCDDGWEDDDDWN